MGTYKTIKLKRGLDLNLQGNISPQSEVPQGARMPIKSEEYAIVPDDFTAIIPRMEVKEGDHVDAGDVLYHDKTFEMIKVTSPVSGTVKAVVRGERRKIERIVIESDGNDTHHEFDVNDDVKKLMLDSGIWVMMRQRPYDVVPSPEVEPRDIFVTCFDSAPLAPNLSLFVKDRQKELDVAAKALKTLTTGNIYLGCRHGDEIEIDGCITTSFVCPHPAGNAGIQAANVMPVNKGDVVWTLDIVTLMRLGKLLTTGKMCFETLVAVTGDQVAEPRYERAIMGCTINSLLHENLCENDKEKRIISGNVLTGSQVPADGFLRAPYRHITVITDIEKRDEFMGWASLSPKKFSIYRVFTSHWLTSKKKPVKLDAKINGGERAIVMSGEYDKMLPMDIYAEFLIKAIIAGDIDKMEKLGIYEIAPEDFALAEFADTSKLELQRIVRKGLDKMRKEMS